MIAGEQQPPIVHALAAIMNEKLGNVGKTVFYTDPVEANPVDQLASLLDLVKDLDAGAVELLIIIGGNPAFNSPVELGMRRPPEEGEAAHSPRPVLRRNQPGVPVADAGDAFPGNLGRRARLRRHGHHPAAADSAALRRPLGDAVAAIADRAAREDVLTRSSRAIGTAQHTGERFRSLVAASGARWRGARHRAAGEERQRPREKLSVRAPGPRSWAASWKSSSGPTPRFTTAASPITAGCRNCPSRSPNSPGTTPRSSARLPRIGWACRRATC